MYLDMFGSAPGVQIPFGYVSDCSGCVTHTPVETPWKPRGTLGPWLPPWNSFGSIKTLTFAFSESIAYPVETPWNDLVHFGSFFFLYGTVFFLYGSVFFLVRNPVEPHGTPSSPWVLVPHAQRVLPVARPHHGRHL